MRFREAGSSRWPLFQRSRHSGAGRGLSEPADSRVVPWPPGGPTDAVARVISQEISSRCANRS